MDELKNGVFMADLTKEQFEQLPDFIKNDYQEVEGVYKHAGVLKLKGTLDGLDAKLKARDSEYSQLNERLSAFEQTKQAEIEAARTKALEEARTKGDVEAIEKRYQEQMQDLEKRVAEKTRGEVEKEFTVKSAKTHAESQLTEIVASLKPVDDDAKGALKALLSLRQQVTEDGKIIYLNSDGSASSLDFKGFIEEAKKDPTYKRLISAETTTIGGGLLTGGIGGSASINTGNLGGNRSEREAAIAKRFNLPN